VRRFALLILPLALVACQRQAQNAAPAPVYPPVEPAPATAGPAAPPAPTVAGPTPEKPSATPPKAQADYRSDLNLTGTEPFWGVQIRKERITLQRPDHPDITTRNPGVAVSGETASWNAGEMAITLKPADCSDGMSDRQYPYAAQVKVGNEVLKGCAYDPAKPPRMPH
jgi:uncharacterized membrane protein